MNCYVNTENPKRKSLSILSALPIFSHILDMIDTNISSVMGSYHTSGPRITGQRTVKAQVPFSVFLIYTCMYIKQPNIVERSNNELFLMENQSVVQIYITLGSKW